MCQLDCQHGVANRGQSFANNLPVTANHLAKLCLFACDSQGFANLRLPMTANDLPTVCL
jgi:hypothetical protein